MAKLTVKASSTSRLEHVFILDSASTTGAGKTGLTNASVTMYYFRSADTTATSVTLSAGTLGTWSTGGFKEVDATNMPGLYEVGMPNAVFAATFNHSVVMIKGTGIAPVVLEYNLVSYDPLDTVRLGLTALPNVAQSTSGALSTGNATGQVTVATNNDKTGYSLATTPPTAAQISTQVWSETTRLLTAGTNIVLAKNTGITGFNDITSQSVWDVLASSVVLANSIGLQLKTNIDATISSRLPTSSYTAPLTAGATASAVWDALLASYTVNNSFGQRILRSASSQSTCAVTGSNHIAADVHELQPAVITASDFSANAIDANALAASAATEIATATWVSDISGVSIAGQAGRYLTDAAVSAANAAVSASVIEGVAYQEEVADVLLGRNIAGGSNGGRTVKDALRILRNKFTASGTALTVYAENDTTVAWTSTLSTDAGATPITGSDPA